MRLKLPICLKLLRLATAPPAGLRTILKKACMQDKVYEILFPEDYDAEKDDTDADMKDDEIDNTGEKDDDDDDNTSKAEEEKCENI